MGFVFTMEITVNGRKMRLEEAAALDRFLEAQGLSQAVVERNGEIIQKDRRHLVVLRDGDVLEIVRLVGGG
jgi:thiamine biosynthesis protein ThiS